MDKFNALMQRKLFGIKYLYYTAAFVVILAFVAWKMKSAGVPADQVQDPDTDTGASDAGADTSGGGTDTDGSGTVSGGGSGGTVPDTSSGGDTGSSGGSSGGGDSGGGETPEPESNDTWARKAIQFLIEGGATIELSTSAIQKYLAGDQLSYAEGQLKDKAVRKFGLPPDIPAVGGTAKKPTTPHKSTVHKPPAVYKVTGDHDNTYYLIAKMFYGSGSDQYIDLLQAANTRLGHKGPFRRGTTVWVPAKHPPRYYVARKGRVSATAIAGANGISVAALKELNDKMRFPVHVGTRVRVA